ncbi:MAG: GGDEF domain-containing protein [Pseudomonadota bacterium]
MRLYALLDWILPRSFVAKAVLVALLFGQGPVLAFLVAWLGGVVPQGLAPAALLGSMALSFLCLALGLAAVMRPVHQLEAAFDAFETGQDAPAILPEHHRDSVGRLMAQTSRLMRTTETRVDAAQRLADRDPLTGLLNRRGLERSLAERHDKAERGAVMMMDLDHFKNVNDAFGHDVGDRVLRDLARLLRRQMRRPDLAARFGGEEFVVFLAGLGQDAALRVAERLRMAVEDSLMVEGRPQTVSIGLALWPPGESFATILKRADMAVYAAKSAGRNRVHLVPLARPSSHAMGEEPAERRAPLERSNLGAPSGGQLSARTARSASGPTAGEHASVNHKSFPKRERSRLATEHDRQDAMALYDRDVPPAGKHQPDASTSSMRLRPKKARSDADDGLVDLASGDAAPPSARPRGAA